jgi:putative phosphoesterase
MLSKAVDLLNSLNVDLLIHCGDWCAPFVLKPLAKARFPIKAVLGNNDPDIQKFLYQLQTITDLKNVQIDIQMEMQDFVVDSKRIAVFHGDDPQVIKMILESQQFDLFCTGHNHVYGIERHGKTLVVNPGSFVGYMYETGPQPVYLVIYDTSTGETQTIDVEKL